jgi:hypothetical protein
MGRWLPAGEIRLQGYKLRELELKENLIRLSCENRRRESLFLVLHGPVSLRDRGVLGKALGRVRIDDRGHLKLLTIAGRKRERLLVCEFMEAEIAAPPAPAPG